MSKLAKRLAAMTLVASMILSTAAFAAPSPTGGNTDTTNVTTSPIDDDNVEVTKATSTANTIVIDGVEDGKHVKVIAKGTVSDKAYDSITFECYRRTQFKANAVSGTAKKSKKIIITKRSTAKKLKAKNFHKNAFKGFKGTIIVKKSAMTKKEFKKLKKKLKGIKKIKYQA